MTNKEFKASIDSVSMSIFSVCKAMNGNDNDVFKTAYDVFNEKVDSLLRPFGVSTSFLINTNIITRVISFKKDKETGTKSFHVSGSAVRSFVKDNILNELVPDWKEKIEKTKKPAKKREVSEEVKGEVLAKLTLSELKALVAEKEEEEKAEESVKVEVVA